MTNSRRYIYDTFKNGDKVEKIATVIALGIIIAIFVAIIGIFSIIDNYTWNDGFHRSCGGQWEYSQAVGHEASTTYMYICNECGKAHEFMRTRTISSIE